MTFGYPAPNMFVEFDEEQATVAPKGDLGVATSPRLRALLHALADEGKHVVIDLSDTTFVDSTTIGVFVGAKRRLSTAGRSLRLISARPSVRRVFELIGLADDFSMG